MATAMPTRLFQYTTPSVYTINDIKHIIIIPTMYNISFYLFFIFYYTVLLGSVITRVN